MFAPSDALAMLPEGPGEGAVERRSNRAQSGRRRNHRSPVFVACSWAKIINGLQRIAGPNQLDGQDREVAWRHPGLSRPLSLIIPACFPEQFGGKRGLGDAVVA